MTHPTTLSAHPVPPRPLGMPSRILISRLIRMVEQTVRVGQPRTNVQDANPLAQRRAVLSERKNHAFAISVATI